MIPQIAFLSYGRPAANVPTVRPSRANGTFASTPSTTSHSVAPSVTAGQFLILNVQASVTGTPVDISSVSDNQGNVWTKVASQKLSAVANNHRTCEMWCAFAKSTGTCTINVAYTGSAAHSLLYVDMFADVNPTQPWAVNPVASANDSTSNIAPSGSINSPQPASLGLAYVMGGSVQGVGPNDAGWTTWAGVSAGSPQCIIDAYSRPLDVENYTLNWGAFSNWVLFRGALKGLGGATPTPVAISSTFTYNAQGAAEAQLYDGNDTTPSADPAGLTTGTMAAFDYGTFLRPTACRVKVANSFGFGADVTFRVQYSDTGLSGPWTNGPTFLISGGTGSIANVPISDIGAHKYWRIAYASGGSLGTNAWLGEVTFS